VMRVLQGVGHISPKGGMTCEIVDDWAPRLQDIWCSGDICSVGNVALKDRRW
jgi:hypothetical protein